MHAAHRTLRRSARATCAGVRWRRALGLVLLLLIVLPLAPRALAHDDPAPPRVVHQVDGSWPQGMRPSSDVVVPLLLTVSAEGSVSDCAVDVSLGPALDAAALDAARQWRFEPARVNGKSVAARARIAVRFHAPEAEQGGGGAAEPGPDASALEGQTPPGGPLLADAGTAGPSDGGMPSPAPDAAAVTTAIAAAAPTAHAHDVTATARSERTRRSASELTRERAHLNAAPHRTGSDLLLTVPGVFVTQHSGEGKAHQIFYRG